MGLYTKSGDQGETGLIGGGRVPKDHPRVESYGDVDELNASIGLAAAACDDRDWREQLHKVQEHLFALGAQLADPAARQATPAITNAEVSMLERWVDSATEAVEPLSQFILPGGSESAARLHAARTVCRRAERSAVALSRSEGIVAPQAVAPPQGAAPEAMVYLNRLGDLLFAWARLANARAGVADTVWTASGRNRRDRR